MEMMNFPCHSKLVRTNLEKLHFVNVVDYSTPIASQNNTYTLALSKNYNK